MSSLSIRNLSLSFGGQSILEDVSTEISGPGNVVLFGPNGAGKSSLLKSIAGIISPQNGEVIINGFSTRNQREKALAQIGAHIEPGSFYPQLTGKEILSFIEKMRGRAKGSDKLSAEFLIESLGMSEYADKRLRTYSSGMRRMLSVASAVVSTPPIVLLDEPTDGLDPVSSKRVTSLIGQLHHEKNCLIVTTSHDIEEAESMATRKLILMNRKIVFDSSNSDKKVAVTMTVSDPENLKPGMLNGHNYTINGNSVQISDLEEHRMGETLRIITGMLNVESVTIGSEFRQFYESFIEESQTGAKNKKK